MKSCCKNSQVFVLLNDGRLNTKPGEMIIFLKKIGIVNYFFLNLNSALLSFSIR